MKTCPICQKLVNDDVKFCYYCGASLMNVAPDAPVEAPAEELPAEPVIEPIDVADEAPVIEPVEAAYEAPVIVPDETPVVQEEPSLVPDDDVLPVAEESLVKEKEPVPVAETPAPEPPKPVQPVVVPQPEGKQAPAQPEVVVQATDSRSLMTTAGYIFTTILFHIPIIGLIFMFVWGCGKPKNISRKRFSLACLIMWLISVICFLLVAVFVLICFSGKIQELVQVLQP